MEDKIEVFAMIIVGGSATLHGWMGAGGFGHCISYLYELFGFIMVGLF